MAGLRRLMQVSMRLLAVFQVALLVVGSSPVFAQGQRARLLLTVTDTTGAVIPNAKVIVVGLEDATRTAGELPPAQTTTEGVASFVNLVPGRYSISTAFPGFEVGLLNDIRLRAGDNKHVVVLKIQAFQDAVT